MEKYGWTLTEVRAQPYLKLLELLNDNNDKKDKKKKEKQEVITGTDLAKLFG